MSLHPNAQSPRVGGPGRGWVPGLLIIPLETTADRFTSGGWVLLAYPRLYAAWLLWAATVKELSQAKGL
jgi:hypothetical protein